MATRCTTERPVVYGRICSVSPDVRGLPNVPKRWTPLPPRRSYSDVPYRYLPSVLQFESVLPSDGMWENVTVFDVMDTRNEVLCYTYE